jgi:thermitase
MLNYLYAIGYLTLLGSAIAWFFFKERENSVKSVFSGAFWIGLATYVLSFLLGDGGWWYKIILLLPRDLMVFSLLVLVFNKFVTKSNIFVGLALAVGIAIRVFYFGVLVESLDERGFSKYSNIFSKDSKIRTIIIDNKHSGVDTHATPLTSSNSADNEAEILVELAEMPDNTSLLLFLNLMIVGKYEGTIEPAFPHLQHKEYTNLENFYKVNIPNNLESDLSKIMTELKNAEGVLSVEINEIVQTTPIISKNPNPKNPNAITNDEFVGNLWGFNNMNIKELHSVLSNMKPQKVAKIYILDTGIDAKHEDLQGSFFSTNKSYDTDIVGHGTHCAGIAAAVSNNAKGIASFSPNTNFVQVTSIKVLNDNGSGTQEGIIDGIIEAADAGADVISMSLGGMSNDERQAAYTEAVEYANKAGAIVVVAAGNSDDDAAYYSPANASGVITVSATDENNNKAEFSNYVNNLTMGIAAPGVNIYSTTPNNTYKYLNGTSMATPYVAGLLGVMKSLNPNLTTAEAYSILKNSGIDTQNTAQTGKLIQPAEAVKRVLNQ